ncbi:armadillo repeat protein deleted in velo-cardio-facial syndrome-like isoform X2 [Amphibalanus amphitrite]|uniref:armadillo repeat protein deleted in velo-cardio-facial syndrome-like isoform X2 n=1 Tax=Amphibalanus amphitrite TaxID=1232801 RepID=UPI001C91A172|nr:armadillo repeat protein deleted in velo-cardio-facial syndrome-like isoform X2 [Amphibalanus amphitrite]
MRPRRPVPSPTARHLLKLAAVTPEAGGSSRLDSTSGNSNGTSRLNGSAAAAHADMANPDCLPELSGGDGETLHFSADLQYHTQYERQQSPPPAGPQTNGGSSQPQPQQQLISRTQKQSTTQQVTTVTKVYRELHHIGPDGQLLEPGQAGDFSAYSAGGPPQHPHSPYTMDPYRPASPGSEQGSRRNYDPYSAHGGYRDYEPYPPPPEYGGAGYGRAGSDYGPGCGPGEGSRAGGYPDRPPTPPSPSDRSDSPPPDKGAQSGYPAGHYPQSGYDELDSTLMASRGQDPYGPPLLPPGHELSQSVDSEPGRPLSRQSRQSGRSAAPRAVFDEVIRDVVREGEQHARPGSALSQQNVRFRDPDLHEVINFLSNPNNVVKANAAAYLQHLCYMDDPMKQKTRALGGIPPLVVLLSQDIPEVHRNACGALRNLSYGRQNDENKRAIKNAGGVPALIRLLRKTPENEIKELVTGILWNLSSCEDLKRTIIDDGLTVLVNYVIIPHSGWNRGSAHSEPVMDVFWSTVFRNATGVLRNVSSAGEYARKKLRECEGLVDALLMVIRSAIGKSNIDNKCVENCVCILRNLSYRCQEVEDPNYDKQAAPPAGRPTAAAGARDPGENAGCFGGKKRRDGAGGAADGLLPGGGTPAGPGGASRRHLPLKGMELLWQPDIVQPYLSLLSDCSNPETLEAAAGAIQNLAACYWQPSVDMRAAVRKEKGLPILVELLRMEADRVVCAVATALRNLAIDQRNKELIGKYAMRDLVQKLPSGSAQQDQATSDDTVAAVLATLNEVIKKSAEFTRSLFELDGVKRLHVITGHRHRYSSRVIKFASQLLYSMWLHQELRDVYRKAGYKENDFVTKSVAARNTNPNSPSNTNSTLNRPMASQGGTKYEDRTMPRGASAAGGNGTYGRPRPPPPDGEHIALGELPGYEPRPPPPGGVRMYPPPGGRQPGEPVYAQVNRDKKARQQAGPAADYEHQPGPGEVWGYRDEPAGGGSGGGGAPAGDSWV